MVGFEVTEGLVLVSHKATPPCESQCSEPNDLRNPFNRTPRCYQSLQSHLLFPTKGPSGNDFLAHPPPNVVNNIVYGII